MNFYDFFQRWHTVRVLDMQNIYVKIFVYAEQQLTGQSVCDLSGDEQNANPPAQSRAVPTKRLHDWKPFLLKLDGKIKLLLSRSTLLFFVFVFKYRLTLLQFLCSFIKVCVFFGGNFIVSVISYTENRKNISVELIQNFKMFDEVSAIRFCTS